MTKIVLDAESFKALASDTRLQILKALDARPLTVSELSRFLDLNKATVFEHLKQLLTAELAKREDDPARKWVYYRLTWKGRNILHPENAQIFLLLGVAALGVGGAVATTVSALQRWLAPSTTASGTAPEAPADNENAEVQRNSAPAAGNDQPSQTQQNMVQDQAGGPPPEEPVAGSDAGNWYDVFSGDVLIGLGLVLFLLLISLLIWSLFGQQRRERFKIRSLLDQLPADVNEAEERVV